MDLRAASWAVSVAKLDAFVEGDGTMAPDPFDDLPRAIAYAHACAKRYLEYAEKCRVLLSDIQVGPGGSNDR